MTARARSRTHTCVASYGIVAVTMTDRPRAPVPWQWRADRASIEAGIPSALAIFETLVAVTAYVLIAFKLGTAHLSLAVFLAPLLLLRTPESTALALGWWSRVAEVLESASFGRFMAIGFAVNGLVVLPITLLCLQAFPAHTPVILVSSLLIAHSSLTSIPTLLLRIAATSVTVFRHPVAACRAIPDNWKRIVLCTDLTVAPEVLPGASTASPEPPAAHLLLPERGLRNVQKAYGPLGPIAVVINALPGFALSYIALMYRWSIKGTALWLFPLAFYTADAPATTPEHFTRSALNQLLVKASYAILAIAAGLALSNFLGTDFGLLAWYDVHLAGPDASQRVLALFPARGISTWQILTLLFAITTTALSLYADRLVQRGYDALQQRVMIVGLFTMGLLEALIAFSLLFAVTAQS